MPDILSGIRNIIERKWTKAPTRQTNGIPALYHTSPRLDPVRVISKKAADVEWRLYSKKAIRRDGDSADAIDEHELYQLLECPCPTFVELDGWSLRYLTFAHIRLVGEFFWLKVRDTRGRIISLLPVPAAWVPKKPTIADHTFLIYPYGVSAGTALTVPADDVVWFKDPDLNDPYANGRGSTEAVLDEVETDEYAAKYQKNFFFNDANPPYAILMENGNEQTVKQIKTGFIQKIAGWMHAKEPLVLTGKGVSIEKLGQNMQEVDMIETRKFLRDQTLQHYQVPPEIYGIIENSNRATIDSAFYLFNKNVLSSDLRFYERVVTAQLCHEWDDDLCFRHDEIIQEDEAFALSVYNAGLANGVITRNEWRTRMRLPEIAGGDVFTMPYSMITVPAKGGEVPAKVEPEKPEIPPDTILEIEGEKNAGGLILKIADSDEVSARKKAIWSAFDSKATSVEPLFVKSVKKISSVQRERVKGAVKSAVRITQSASAIESALAKQFDSDSDKAVKSTLAPAWIKSLEAGKDQALSILGDGGKAYAKKADSDSVINAWFNKWIEKQGLAKAKQINDTSHEELLKVLRTELADAIDNGESLSKMIDRLMVACDGVYDNMDGYRAELIARTESASTVNAGTYATYEVEGVDEKQWLSTLDDRTRDAHADMMDVTVKIGEPFVVDGEEMEYPGDPSASAGNICNCFLPDAIPEGVFVAASKSFYSGKIRVITTRSGKRLPVTVNHPIMTNRGWVKAGCLKIGDNTFSYTRDIGGGLLGNPNDKNVPASISEIFDSFSAYGVVSAKTGNVLDFYGDGPIDNSDINVVSINGELPFAFNSEKGLKGDNNVKFIFPVSDILLSIRSNGSLCKLNVASLLSSNSIMSGLDLISSSGGVFLDFGPFKALGIGRPSNWNPGFRKASGESNSSDAGFLRELIHASSGEISSDEIVDIVDSDFSGHVYDLQSVDNYIMCNGILSSNCRCSMIPIVK